MKYLFFPLFVFILACGSEQGEAVHAEPSSDSLAIDSVVTDTILEEIVERRIEIDQASLFDKIDSVFSTPLVIDSMFVDSIMGLDPEENALTNAEVQYLGFDLIENRPNNMASYSIKNFIRIDSLKIKGEYEEYLATLDVGMTEWVAARVIGLLKIDEGHELFLWCTQDETLQACPYGHGTYIWATVFVDGQPLNTTLVGEHSGGADAPYWIYTFTTSIVSKVGIEIDYLEESGGDYDEENDEEIIEQSVNKYTVNFAIDGGFEVVD